MTEPDSKPQVDVDAKRASRRELWVWAQRERRAFALGSLALLATNALGYAVPAFLGMAIDRLRHAQPVLWLCVGMFAAALIQALVRIASRLLIFNAARDVEQQMREHVFGHVMSLSPRDLSRFSAGDLQSRLTNDLTNVRLLFGAGMLNMVNTTLAYVCALPMLLWYGGWLALVALAPYPFLMWAMNWLAKRIFVASADAQKRLGALTNFVSESIGARLFIIASAWFEVEKRRFDKHNEGYFAANIRASRSRTLLFPLGSMAGALSVFMVLALGGQEVIAGRMTLGGLVAFNAYLAMLAFPTLMLGFMIAMGQRGLASYQRVREVLMVKPWQGGDAVIERAPQGVDLSVTQIRVRRGSGDAAREVLNDVSLSLRPAEWLGVVGEVGSGKTTLLSVLARLDIPAAGIATISERNASEWSFDSLRRHIALVPQQPFLFSASIFDNVASGRDVTAAQVHEALEWAAVLDEMRQLPEGLDTVVGERGVTLSGGQRQRVVLARALVGRPAVLLLDDCLSAVDSSTEHRIIEALFALPFKPSVVIASHRLAIFERIKHVIVLAQGRIEEEGSHDHLLQKNGTYARLYRRQRLREQLGEAA